MNLREILKVTETITGKSYECIVSMDRHQDVIFARYLIVVIGHEEGYKNSEIAKFIGVSPSGITHALKTIDNLLMNNKFFKRKYLACIAEISKNERK